MAQQILNVIEGAPEFFNDTKTVVAIPETISTHRMFLTKADSDTGILATITVKKDSDTSAHIANLWMADGVDTETVGRYMLQQAVIFGAQIIGDFGVITSSLEDDNREGLERHTALGFIPGAYTSDTRRQFELSVGGYSYDDDWNDDDWDDDYEDDVIDELPALDDGSLYDPDNDPNGDDPFASTL